jgi:anti-anti-sigma factor
MTLVATTLGTAQVLALGGRLDSEAAPDLELKLQREVRAETKTLILELSGVEYLSSAGLRQILTAGKELQAKGGKLVLCVPKGATRQVIEASGFHKLFPICANLAEAGKHTSAVFLIHMSKEWEVDVMTVFGRVDAERAPEVEAAGRKVLEMPYLKLIINLSAVDYLSSAGLCALLNLMKLAKEKHGRLFVCSPSPSVQQIIKMSGFDKILPIRATVQDAITE